jgi:hypothetical protein
MKSLARRLLVGWLTAALASCGAGILLAGPTATWKGAGASKGSIKDMGSAKANVKDGNVAKWQGPKSPGGKGPGGPGSKGPKGPPMGHPGHHPGHHHHHHPYGPYPVVGPVIVEEVTTYAESDDANPAPTADIQLVNPAENRVTLRFRLDDGELQSLPAGRSINIDRAVVITFDQGGNSGRARYSLTDGAYKFAATGRTWDLFRVSAQAAAPQYADADANPMPEE